MEKLIQSNRYCPGDKPGSQRFNKGAAALFLTILLAFFNGLFSGAALAAEPDNVSFTLEGCKSQAGYNPDASPPDLVCDDAGYTTGNLGKLWNELDLVPHRLTAQAGQAAPASQQYIVAIAADNEDGSPARPGYDVISNVVLNTVKSDSSCQLNAVGAQTVMSPGLGGISKTIFRTLTITQAENTTCVIDYVERLAVGSHLFPGSSLHSNKALPVNATTVTTSGIGAADVSIPVKEISPQELAKDMTATQNNTHAWQITKGPTPAALHFGDVCERTDAAPFEEDVTIKVTWTKLAASPSGDITVLTQVFATNPAARIIAVNVDDDIRSGTTVLDSLNSGNVDVPKNTANFLVLSHQTTVPSGTTDLNDVATATYTDNITGVAVPGTSTATASANVDTGTTLNGTATITDSESITGSGLTFKVATPSPGSFTNYTAGTATTGPVNWSSGLQSDSSFVDFEKTVILASKQVTSGTLSDTAILNGTDGFGPIEASASVGIDSTATVTLTVEKTIPDILETGEKIEVDYHVTGPNGVDVTKTFVFGAGETLKSDTVSGNPGTYSAEETRCEFFADGSNTPEPCGLTADKDDDSVDLSLPSCTGKLSFINSVGEANSARIQVKKITQPVTDVADPWSFTLSCTGFAPDEVKDINANQDFSLFDKILNDNTTCTVTETLKDNWELLSASPSLLATPKVCTITIDLPEDGGIHGCTFTNREFGEAEVVKTVSGAAPTGSQAFTFQLRKDASTLALGTILETKDANATNGGEFKFTTDLVPGNHYQICELVFPGWNTNLGLAGTLFVPGSITPPNLPNPNVDNLPVCVDFTVNAGETKTFTVDNSPPPGGRALTIGFWRNWSSCTGGHQAPILDQTLTAAGGVLIGDLLVDTCPEGVAILSKRDLNGKIKASDPAFNLAAQLLAYRLNILKGAGTCGDAVTAAINAQLRLDQLNFNGLTHGTISKSLASELNGYATTLDKFNNNNLCL